MHANIIMCDISETFSTLLSPTGEDDSMLSQAEVESNDLLRLNYAYHDKIFEGAANLAKKFSKFPQDKRKFCLKVGLQLKILAVILYHLTRSVLI
ncbi:hypothetical protein ACHAW6_010145 [Cyclotella cf. meneghiniana]